MSVKKKILQMKIDARLMKQEEKSLKPQIDTIAHTLLVPMNRKYHLEIVYLFTRRM